MIKVEIEMDQYGTKNWQWFVKRVPITIVRAVNDCQCVRDYFSPYGWTIRGVRFL